MNIKYCSIRELRQDGFKCLILYPSFCKALTFQLTFGEIISTDTNKKDSIFIERGIPINTVHFMPDLSGSMLTYNQQNAM